MRRRTACGRRHLTFQKLEDRLALSLASGEANGIGFTVNAEDSEQPNEETRQAAVNAEEAATMRANSRRGLFASRWRSSQRLLCSEIGDSGFGIGSAATLVSSVTSARVVDLVFGQPGDLDSRQLEVTGLPDIEYRSTKNDFAYSSEHVIPKVLDGLITTTRNWAQHPERAYSAEISSTESFLKTDNQYPSHFAPDGHIVAKRVANFDNSHSLLLAQKKQSDHFLESGKYLRQDHHYHISFDVRHPASEISWLRDHNWAIVHQLWGPREPGESARNPPFAIYTSSRNRMPVWVVRSYGDARQTTHTGQFQETNVVQVPYENINQWHHWDIEYVPNPFGKGLVRTWLDGKLVAEWLNIKSNYFSMIDDSASGPLSPAFGLYSPLVEDGMEAHFDNINIQSNGRYDSSISGRVTGPDDLRGNIVFATDLETEKRFGVRTGKSGIYTLALPQGVYSLTVVNKRTHQQRTVGRVLATAESQMVDITLQTSTPLSQRGARGRLSSGR